MQSVAAAFLAPCLNRPNLTTRPFCQATKVVWDRDRVIGVEYVASNSDPARSSRIRLLPAPWNIQTALARREVIICAGVVESPRLLMLSGAGPAEQLRRHGIAVKINLPGVGQNLQDHLNINFIYHPNPNIGPIRDRIGTSGLFLRTHNGLESAAPDLQLFVLEVVVQQEAFGLKPGPLYFCTACLVRPQSRGNITLASADPMAAPLIRANYLQSQADLDTLIAGFALVRRLAQAAPLNKLLAGEMIPGAGYSAPEQIEEFVRQSAETNFHPVGACKMGHDTMAVVDPQLRVHGAQGLRIADASIMPTIVNGNTIAACVMIGEKASEMIRNTTRTCAASASDTS